MLTISNLPVQNLDFLFSISVWDTMNVDFWGMQFAPRENGVSGEGWAI